MNFPENFSKDSCFFVAGHRGMVGSAVARQLKKHGFNNIVTRTHVQLDLTQQQAVRDFFASEKIDYVIMAAAKVGGIHANNTYPAEFIYNNLIIESIVIHEAYMAGIKNLLFLGSSCIYPKHAPQPMQEKHLLTSELEPTNEPYAIAKIAGIKLCESYNRQYDTQYRSVMPTNLYGPHDNYNLENSHVLPALIRKFHLAKLAMHKDLDGIKKDIDTFGTLPDYILDLLGLQQNASSIQFLNDPKEPIVEIWGTGKAYREFLHVEDMAAACIFVMNLTNEDFLSKSRKAPDNDCATIPSFLNVGAGKDITIENVVTLISEITGFKGTVIFNKEKPDGTPRKLMDSSQLNNLGWKPEFSLRDGLKDAYSWYCKEISNSA